MAARAPKTAMSGPPTRLPNVEAPATTVAWAVSATRRSAPVVARVTRAAVAALPAGITSPIATAVAPMTTGVGRAAITSQPTPAAVQAAEFSSAGRRERAARIPPSDPAREPSEYDVIPTVARSRPRPVSAPSTANPRVKANHAAQPVPRTSQPSRTSGCRPSSPRTRGISSSSPTVMRMRTVATRAAPTSDSSPSSATVGAVPIQAISGSVASGARVIAARTEVS